MKKLRDIALGTALALSSACMPYSFIKGKGIVDYHPLIQGCVENLSVEISHNQDESWRAIRVKSPDGRSVEAEDYVTDNDGKFDIVGHMGDFELNHPLRKYISFEVLEKLYTQVKNGELKCS